MNASGSRMRAVDVRLGGEVHDGVGVGDERPTASASAMSPWTNRSRAAASGRLDRREVRPVAGVGQLVEDRDRGAVVAGQDVADVARADEAGPARDEEPAVRRGPPVTAPGARPAGERAGLVVVRRELGRPEQRRHRPGVGPVALVDRLYRRPSGCSG
jgi:hypothetical protein